MEKTTEPHRNRFPGKGILLLLLFLPLFAGAAGKSVDFRAGTILSAEVSTKKPAIASDKGKDIPNGVWAEVVVKLHPGRSIGVYDYVLQSGDQEFPCRAIALNSEPYDASRWEIRDAGNSKCRLLFQPARPEEGKEFEYRLTVKLIDSDSNPPPLLFRNREKEAFTDPAAIPETGQLEEKPAGKPEAKK